jgi:hypothetical protein
MIQDAIASCKNIYERRGVSILKEFDFIKEM